MRVLQLGDTHLGIARRAWGAPPGWARAHDHADALAEALAPERLARIDLVVHTGDVFDRSRPPADAVQAAHRLLRGAARQVPVVVLAGNHDRQGLGHTLGPSAGGLHVVNQPERRTIRGLDLAFIPHLRHATAWAQAAAAISAGSADVVVTHQGVAGAWVPGFTFRPGHPTETLAAHHLPRGARLIWSGHLHPHQRVALGDAQVVYAGSTAATSFSETGQEKGVVEWDLTGTPSARFCPLAARPMIRVEGPDQLARVSPGAWVGMPPRRLRELGPAVVAAGGIVALPPTGPRRDRRQLGLFEAAASPPLGQGSR